MALMLGRQRGQYAANDPERVGCMDHLHGEPYQMPGKFHDNFNSLGIPISLTKVVGVMLPPLHGPEAVHWSISHR